MPDSAILFIEGVSEPLQPGKNAQSASGARESQDLLVLSKDIRTMWRFNP